MIGSLVLVKVPGQITEKAIIEEYKTDKKLYFKTPTNFVTRITNLGNVHVKPRGGIEIKGWFGAPKEKIAVNDQGGNVLPNSTRKFENKWEFSKFAFGYFSAKLDLVYGDSEKTLTDKVSFWIIPWWLIIVVTVLIIVTVLVVLWLKKKKKNKKPKQPLPPHEQHQNPQPPIQPPSTPQNPTPPQGPVLR